MLNVTRSNCGLTTQTTTELSEARDAGHEEREIRDSDNVVNNAGTSSKGGVFNLVSDVVDVVTGEGGDMDRDACSEEEETNQFNTTSPTSLLETVETQTALVDTMDTEEGDGIPMSQCGSFGASPDTFTSVEVETLGASMDQNVERNGQGNVENEQIQKMCKSAK